MTSVVSIGVLVRVARLDDAELGGERGHVGAHLLLHQVEGHGEQRDAEQQVQRAQRDRVHRCRRVVHALTLVGRETEIFTLLSKY